jgi:hypothetical protein
MAGGEESNTCQADAASVLDLSDDEITNVVSGISYIED